MHNINNILSNREIAILIWGVIYFFLAILNSTVRTSLYSVFISFWNAKKTLTIFILFPTLISVYILIKFIELNFNTWKEILIWVVISAFLSLPFEFNKVKSSKEYFNLLIRIILSTPLIWIAVDFTSFSIWIELLIIPVWFLLTKLHISDELNHDKNRNIKKLVRSLYYGCFVFWGYSLCKTIHNPEFWSIATLHIYFITPFLTVVYALLAYPILLIVNYESSFKAINTIIDIKYRADYRNKIWIFCRFNLDKINHCNFYIYNREEQSSETLKETINSAITSYKKQYNKYEIQNN